MMRELKGRVKKKKKDVEIKVTRVKRISKRREINKWKNKGKKRRKTDMKDVYMYGKVIIIQR